MHRAFRDARSAAFPPGQYVDQENFMRADEVLSLARRAGIGKSTDVLDLCCGVAGPGRLIVRRTGCRYLGVDASRAAIAIARERCQGLDCRFQIAQLPPIPAGQFDVALLLETMLAFGDKQELIAAIAASLRPGGRFACTVEEGSPLTDAERSSVPDADTVWPISLGEFTALLQSHGLTVSWQQDCTGLHREVIDALVAAVSARRSDIAAQVGTHAVDDLLRGHRWWSSSLRSGRVQKFAVVARKP